MPAHTIPQADPLGMPCFKDGAEGYLAALQLGFISPKTSQLHAMAACTAQALFTVGSSSAMCFEPFSPNLLWGPVQALTMHSPEPPLLQEKLSQHYSLGGKHQPKVTQTRKQFVLFWLHSHEKKSAEQGNQDHVWSADRAPTAAATGSVHTRSLTDRTEQGKKDGKRNAMQPLT